MAPNASIAPDTPVDRAPQIQPGWIARAAYPLGVWASRTFPSPVHRWISRRLAGINFRCDRRAREAVIENLRVVLGPDVPERSLRRMARDTFNHFAYAVGELLGAAPGAYERLREDAEVIGEEATRDLKAKGRPMVVVGAHLGNWELAGGCASRLCENSGCVALTYQDPKVAAIFAESRAALGMKPLDMNSCARTSLEILRSGGTVGLVGDRVYGGQTTEVTFFGHRVLFPSSPARMAVTTGADMVPIMVTRHPDFGYRIHWHPPLRIPQGESRSRCIQSATQQFAKVLEAAVRRTPTQWIHFYPFFQGAPVESATKDAERTGKISAEKKGAVPEPANRMM